MHRVAVAAVVGAVLVGFGAATPARAGPPVVCDPLTKRCTVIVNDPGGPGGAKPGDEPETTPVGTRPKSPCVSRPALPQPPASDPIWAGDPGNGVVYIRTCPLAVDGFVSVSTPVLVRDGEAAPGDAVVTPAQLAQQALATVALPKPSMGRSPSARDDGRPYTWVNVWTWYWTSRASWRPVSARAAAGATWAEVTVQPQRLTFHPGDGSAASTCAGPGRPWRPADGSKPPADGGCGHVYSRVTRGTPVTARMSIRWAVSWTGSGGETGTLPVMTTTASAQFDVQQIQAVNS